VTAIVAALAPFAVKGLVAAVGYFVGRIHQKHITKTSAAAAASTK